MKKASCFEFKIACASDLHLGHKRVPSSLMTANLRKSFHKGKDLASLDVLVLAGDVLDHLLNWPQDDIRVIEDWMIDLLRDCAACDVELWVLEGTPSHDRRQSKQFEVLNERLGIGCQLSYVDELCIKYFPRFGIHVLFVPDEWTDSADKTLAEVGELLLENGIKKVDYAIMHGQFDFQLPDVVQAQKHDSDAYLQIVDKLIFIGHIHVFGRKDRIIAQGSHDRISHGEEGPKGYVRARVRSRDDYEIEFVENKGAAIFRTIELEDVSLSDAIVACRKIAASYEDGANLRVRASPEEWSLAQLINEMEMEFPGITWTSIDRTSKDRIKKLTQELAGRPKLPDLITIEPTNVTRLVSERIYSLDGADSASVAQALKILEELK